jgi:DNA-binding GntR family transcriptional regulator
MVNSNYRSKNQIVYELIRDDIISGVFPPGRKLVIDTLAIRYEVSHSPIRECLRLLEAEGFVTIRPYAGVTVTDIQPQLIIEVFTILESLEIMSSCRASHNASEKQMQQLGDLIDAMEADLDSPEQWSKKNMELHMFICDIADMTISKHMMYRTLLHWNRLRRYYLEDVSAKRIEHAQQEHRDMFAAMKSEDDQKIAEVIHHHNKVALNDYLMFIKQTQQIDLTS